MARSPVSSRTDQHEARSDRRVGGILGILTAVCIVWIGLIFDDSPDGIAPLVMFGLFAALFVAGMFAAMGAVVGVVAKAIGDA